MANNKQFPNQRVSHAEKQKPHFYKPTTDYIINRAKANRDEDSLLKLIRAAKGIIDPEVFSYVVRPYGQINSELMKDMKLPGSIRDVSLITPILEKRMGEFIKQFHNFQVKVNNPDAVYKKNEKLSKEVVRLATDAFMQMVQQKESEAQQQGQQQGQAEPIPDIKEFVKDFQKKYIDERAIQGQAILEAIIDWTDAELKYVAAYYNWIVTGETYTYRDVRHGNLIKETISPLEYYPINNGSDFVEDHDAGMRHLIMSYNQIMDNFDDRFKLSEKDRLYLKTIFEKEGVHDGYMVKVDVAKSRMQEEYYFTLDTTGTSDQSYIFAGPDGLTDVYHVVWKTESKVGVLQYYGMGGTIEEMEVSEDYKLDTTRGDISIEWIWKREYYETYRISGEEVGIYFKPQPVIVQRSDVNDTNVCKSPYNGKMNLFKGAFNHSIVKRLLDFEILYKIYHLQRERMISKGVNSGMVTIIPQSLLKGEFLSQEENLYFLLADGKVIANDSDPNFHNIVSGFKIIDAGLGRVVTELGGLIREIKEEAWDSVGWNRQRDGGINASDGKGVTEQAIIRSAMGSVLDNYVFNKIRERDYEADLDFSKLVFVNATPDQLVGTYSAGDEIKDLIVNGKEHANANYGVHIVNDAIENENLKLIKDILIAGRTEDLDLAVEAINAKNITTVQRSAEKYRKIKQDFDMLLKQKDQELAQYVQEKEDARVERELASKESIAFENNQASRDVALINADAKIATAATSGQDTFKGEELQIKRDAIAASERIAEQNRAQKDREIVRKERMKKEELKSKERIVKANNKTTK